MALSEAEEQALRALLDKQAIHEVVLRYCRGIDRMDRDLVRACYHDDAVDVHGSFSGTVDEYLDWVWRVTARNQVTFHFIGNVLVELHGELARSESYGVSIHTRDSREPAHNLIIGFRYVDDFAKRAGEWRIQKRIATTEWSRVARPDDEWPIPEGMPVGSRDREDPVYAPFD